MTTKTNNKTYDVVIKTSSTCPQKANVLSLLDNNAASFKTVIGEELLRGFYPVYVDVEDKPNMYGSLQKVLNGETQLSNDEIKELIVNGAQIVLSGYTGTLIQGKMILDEVKKANVDTTTISSKLQAVIDEKIAAGIVTKEEMDDVIKVLQENKVDEALKIRVIKGYRKYNKKAHKPRCIYVDPYIDQVKAGKEGIIAEGLRNAVSRMASICEGEKSVGKNVYMETIAWLLGMPLYMLTFSRNMSPSSIYGEKSTDNSASEKLKNMKTEAIAKVMLETNNITSEEDKKRAEAERDEAIALRISMEKQKAELERQQKALEKEKKEMAEKLYEYLLENGIEAIIDDREDISLGARIGDCNILGTPYLTIFGDKADTDVITVESTKDGEKTELNKEELVKFLKK